MTRTPVAERALPLGEFFERHDAALVAYFARRVASADLASDLAQDVWLKLARHRATFEAIESPYRQIGFLFRVAENRLRDHYRRDALRRARLTPLDPFLDALDGNGDMATVVEQGYYHEIAEAMERESADAEELACARDDLNAARQWLIAWAGTPLRQKVVALYLRGMTPREIHAYLKRADAGEPLPGYSTIKNVVTLIHVALGSIDARPRAPRRQTTTTTTTTTTAQRDKKGHAPHDERHLRLICA